MGKLLTAVAVCLFPLFSACAAMPDYIGPEFEHMSHASQHFGPDRTNYGSELLGVTAEWGKPAGPYLDITESIDLDPCRMNFCGEIAGPKEQFSARLGWRFHTHKE